MFMNTEKPTQRYNSIKKFYNATDDVYFGLMPLLDKITKDMATKLQGTGVAMNLVDPGWCRTDLGGPNAPNSPESAIPGVVVGAFVSDETNGKLFRAQDFAGMELSDAVAKAEEYDG